MSVLLRMTRGFWHAMHEDLARPHLFAFERVGFLTCDVASLPTDGVLLVSNEWHSVDDGDYARNPLVGAEIGPRAFRKVLEAGYNHPSAIFHVHRHEHHGLPAFSRTDLRSMREFVPGFFNACPNRPHGALVLSLDAGAGLVWSTKSAESDSIRRFDVVGAPLASWRPS